MTEAMQMTVSSEIANRMDDSSSTACAQGLRSRSADAEPWVEADMRKKGSGLPASGKKGGPRVQARCPPCLGLFVGG
jgi:hypothetical protein